MKNMCCVHLEKEKKMPLIKRQDLKPVRLLGFKIDYVYFFLMSAELAVSHCYLI